ncbi:MAG: phospholipase A [Desulfurivibrionaceae bacterium]|nr:phospholipase A [Desulfurivibrionaceae bacterium]
MISLRLASILFLTLWLALTFQNNPLAAEESPRQKANQPNPDVTEYPTLEDLFTLYQPYLDNISPYEPIYFLIGANPERSKFQFSFRYRLLNSNGPLAAGNSWVKGLHFGYTQTSFWDLKSDSAPFEDTSYKPELFHLTDNLAWRPSWLKGLFLQSGLLHESNGQAEDLSRTTNILYLKPIAILYDQENGLGLQVVPKIWFYFRNSEEHNKDLPDYRGYFELGVKAGEADGLVTTTALRWAREGGSIQVDFDLPIHGSLSENLEIYLHCQYVNALAESMLHYRERTEAFRIGISFIR